jgi:hypothetical protein
MIVYNLRCANSHEFEGWFKDSATYDDQAASDKLVCPICNSKKIEKAIMAPSVSGTKKTQVSAPDEMRKMRQFMTGLRKHVLENAENVGPRFAEEARKIHYGEIEERPIYGETSMNEAIELVEEGIDVAPLPPDMDEAN